VTPRAWHFSQAASREKSFIVRSMSSEGYHEPVELLSEAARDQHRAIVSLREELEAVDWYAQRAEATANAELRAILLHNRREEIEHAMMVLEWIRRSDATFAEHIQTYVGSSGPITELEAAQQAGAAGASDAGAPRGATSSTSLGIGSLKGAL
jgi:ferritin-like protein